MIYLVKFPSGVTEVIIADTYDQAFDYAKTLTDNPKVTDTTVHDLQE